MPGALSSSNRSQLAYRLEGVYPTNFGTVITGKGLKLNMLSESLDAPVKNVSSKSIRSDRQVPDLVQTGFSAQGGFAFEAQYKEYDPFILGVLQSAGYTAYGTAGVSTTLLAITSITTAANITTITFTTAPTGLDALSGLQRGQWFMLRPPVSATQAVRDYFASRPLRVSLVTLPTGTNLTLDVTTPIVTAITGTTMAAAAVIGTSRAANGNVMTSYALEMMHEDLTPAVYRRYNGMIPSKMDLKLGVGEIVTGSFEFMGANMVLSTVSVTDLPNPSQTFTPANATKGVFDIIENGTSITVTTYIKSADISIDNSLRQQEAVGVFGVAGIAAGTMMVKGKLEVYFADTSIYARFLSGAASSLCIPLIDVDGNGYVYYFPRIKYETAKVNVGGLDQDNMLSMDFMALPDTLIGSPTIGQTVVIYRVGS